VTGNEAGAVGPEVARTSDVCVGGTTRETVGAGMSRAPAGRAITRSAPFVGPPLTVAKDGGRGSARFAGAGIRETGTGVVATGELGRAAAGIRRA
jgi:hypothetical protein